MEPPCLRRTAQTAAVGVTGGKGPPARWGALGAGGRGAELLAPELVGIYSCGSAERPARGC